MIRYMVLILIFLLSACDGSETSEQNQSFDVSIFRSIDPGVIFDFQVTGIDTSGSAFSGSVSLVNQAVIMLDGVLVTPQVLTLTVISSGTSTVTYYLNSAGSLIRQTDNTTAQSCQSVSPDTLPSTVMIGDSGTMSTMTCNTSVTIERNWRIGDGGNGNGSVILTTTEKTLSNTVNYARATTFTINSSGNIIAIRSNATFPPSNSLSSYESI